MLHNDLLIIENTIAFAARESGSRKRRQIGSQTVMPETNHDATI
jgi:hypothetical protein